MDFTQFFPLTIKVNRRNPATLVIVIGIYLAICAVVKVGDLLLGWIPLIGIILGLLFWLVGLYCAVGIIVAVLEYFRSES